MGRPRKSGPHSYYLKNRERLLARVKYRKDCISRNEVPGDLYRKPRKPSYTILGKTYAERKLWAVKQLGGCCKVCGYKDHPAALDFDHIDPETKEYAMGTLFIGCNLNTLAAELDKCQLLCANCHRIKSFEERQALKARRKRIKALGL